MIGPWNSRLQGQEVKCGVMDGQLVLTGDGFSWGEGSRVGRGDGCTTLMC